MGFAGLGMENHRQVVGHLQVVGHQMICHQVVGQQVVYGKLPGKGDQS